MRRLFAIAGALAAASCGQGVKSTLSLQPTKNSIVDNLFIATGGGGNTAPMGGAVGRFSLKERCLVVNTDGVDRTPVFAGLVDVGRDGLKVGPTFIPYGTERTLPMIGSPLPITSLQGSACPQESVFIRSLGD